jgi:hypothetical protein
MNSTETPSLPAEAAKATPAIPAQVASKTAAAPVKTSKAVTKASAKAPEKKAVKAVAVAAKPAVKTVVKPVVKAPAKVIAKAAPKALPKLEKPAKEKKQKLVRDSFTMPKGEYNVIADLKERAGKLSCEIKKSELIRAGIKALANLSDTNFVAALKLVPTIKTGRPSKS